MSNDGGFGRGLDPNGQFRIKDTPEQMAAAAAAPISPWSGGVPQYPGYQSILNPDGTLPGQLQSNPQYETDMMARLRQDGMNGSPWTQMMLSRQGVEQAQARQEADQRSASAQAQAQAQMQARGGMDSGARMRLAMGGNYAQMQAGQNVARQGEVSRYDIRGKGEDRRSQALNQALGISDARTAAGTQAGQFNIANALKEKQQQEAAKLAQYHEQASMYGAGKTADATENADSGSSFICTALRAHGLMSLRETVIMTKFMLRGLWQRADFFAWYFRHGKKAIEMAERQNFDWAAIKNRFVDEIIALIPEDEELAQTVYIGRAVGFVKGWTGAPTPDGVLKTGMWKSLRALPSVLILPSTWKWAFSYAIPRVKKFGLRKVRQLVA